MSVKALRKLREMQAGGSSTLDPAKPRDSQLSSEELSENDENVDESLNAHNRFDILLGSQSDTDVKEDDDLTECGDENIAEQAGRNERALIKNASGARKKKKKKKKKGHPVKLLASSEDHFDDEVEKSVREVNAILGEVPVSDNIKIPEDKSGKKLLTVEHRHLNPQNEMKRIFGAKVVQANDVNRRRNHRAGGSSRSNRGTWIVPGHSNWDQHPKPGISMVLEESNPDYNIFKFQHSPTYQQAQFRFLVAVESLNHENILAMLNLEPFHVDTLLQVSDIFHMADDSMMAAQLIERAIYVLESSTHPLFNISAGNCRLQFKQQENRCFFVLIFKHILNVGMKGCYRTALELCKLLLNFSPDDDPMAVSLMLDFYALRAQEYSWLVALYDHYEPIKNLSMLPNFSFSVPLALFHLSVRETAGFNKEKQEKLKNQYKCSGIDSPSSLRKRADAMLQRAIIMFPGVVRPLLDKCNIHTDSSPQNHSFFEEKGMNEGLSQISKLYVGRNYHVWKEPDVIVWFEQNFNAAVKRIDSSDPLVSLSEEKRKSRYQGAPMAIYRHILLANIQDATAVLPPSLSTSPVLSFDPLPPLDNICDYERPKITSKEGSQARQNLLSSFFRSLLPSYDVTAVDVDNQPNEENYRVNIRQRNQDQLDGAALEAEIGLQLDNEDGAEVFEGAGAEGGETRTGRRDLRESVNTLLEAMRDLLSNMHGPPNDEESSDENRDHQNGDDSSADTAGEEREWD